MDKRQSLRAPSLLALPHRSARTVRSARCFPTCRISQNSASAPSSQYPMPFLRPRKARGPLGGDHHRDAQTCFCTAVGDLHHPPPHTATSARLPTLLGCEVTGGEFRPSDFLLFPPAFMQFLPVPLLGGTANPTSCMHPHPVRADASPLILQGRTRPLPSEGSTKCCSRKSLFVTHLAQDSQGFPWIRQARRPACHRRPSPATTCAAIPTARRKAFKPWPRPLPLP